MLSARVSNAGLIDYDDMVTAGKKTFSSLVTKVKAKMQEFDQSRFVFHYIHTLTDP